MQNHEKLNCNNSNNDYRQPSFSQWGNKNLDTKFFLKQIVQKLIKNPIIQQNYRGILVLFKLNCIKT